MKKYVTVRISGIIVQIAETTEVEGYTRGILEAMLPDDEKMTTQEVKQWTKENNKRMVAICRFLNEE